MERRRRLGAQKITLIQNFTSEKCTWTGLEKSGQELNYIFSSDVQFGHAGASAGGEAETATSKNKALSEAGATVPASFNEFGKKIGEVYEDLVKKGVIVPQPEVEILNLHKYFKLHVCLSVPSMCKNGIEKLIKVTV